METWYLKKKCSSAFHRRRCCILRRGQGHYDLKPEGAGLECHLDALRLEVGESMWSFKAPWWTKLDTFWGIWSLLDIVGLTIFLQSSWAWLIWGYDCDTTVWWLCLSFRSRSQSRKGTCRNGTCMGSTQRWCLLFLAGLHTWVACSKQLRGVQWFRVVVGSTYNWGWLRDRYHAPVIMHS